MTNSERTQEQTITRSCPLPRNMNMVKGTKGCVTKLHPYTPPPPPLHHHLHTHHTFAFSARLAQIAINFFKFSTPIVFEYGERRAWITRSMHLHMFHKLLIPPSNYFDRPYPNTLHITVFCNHVRPPWNQLQWTTIHHLVSHKLFML